MTILSDSFTSAVPSAATQDDEDAPPFAYGHTTRQVRNRRSDFLRGRWESPCGDRRL